MRTKFKTLPKLHLCCSNDLLRPVMNHILVTKDKAVASDSHILIEFNTAEIFDEAFIEEMPERFLIHSDNWKVICKKHYGIQFHDEKIQVFTNGYSYFVPIVLEKDINEYPEYTKILTDLKREPVGAIGINPTLLNKLAQAIGTTRIEMHFNNAGSAINIKVPDVDGVRAIIMPQMIDR